MSNEKIDLASIVENLRAYDVADVIDDDELLALVRAVRAARALARALPREGYHPRSWPAFLAALAPFTDSAEDQS